MRERIKWLDSVKGLAILLVVIGHTLRGYTSAGMYKDIGGILEYIDFTIYSFHMPLFFIISGYLYYKFTRLTNYKDYLALIKNKFCSLMIPYFIFCSVQLLIKIVLDGATNKGSSVKDIIMLPLVPREQFWFIYALFFIFALVAFLDIKIKNRKLILAVLFLLKITHLIWEPSLYAIEGVIDWAFYFYLGTVIVENETVSFSMYGVLYLVLNIVIFKFGFIDNFALKIIIAIVGSLLIISSFRKFSFLNKSKIFNLLGKYSFEIFLLHTIIGSGMRIVLIKLGVSNMAIHLIFDIGTAIVIPIVIGMLAKKMKIIDIFFRPSKYILKSKNNNIQVSQ